MTIFKMDSINHKVTIAKNDITGNLKMNSSVARKTIF